MDDELRMLFLSAHPSLSAESKIAFTLKTCCGLSTAEIAKGLLSTEAAIAQRLVRAKAQLREAQVSFAMPEGEELTVRLRTVLRVLYLMFNEGYLAHVGPELTNSDLCDEAILLTSRLANTPVGDQPDTRALLALMLLHSSRLPARVDAEGALRLLEDQDRTLWDTVRIGSGLEQLALAASGEEMSPYHCEAAIAAAHCAAPSFGHTHWTAILEHYDDLMRIAPSPICRLNRAIAISQVHGSAAGLSELEGLQIEGYYLLPATRGKLQLDLGRFDEAQREYQRALALATNEAEKRFLERSIARCVAMEPMFTQG
jgi:RNA polymerase sigma-70 factor (ECF subfamily)